jgi:shikimate dehydrogenase
LCDTVSPGAAALRSVNTVTLAPCGTATGDSTDGAGFLRSLADADVDVAGRAVLLLGAGGAARAVAWALGAAGARVVVAARREAAAAETAALAKGAAIAWDDRAPAALAADIVVNATSVGMAGDAGLPIPADGLRSDHVVADLVYEPRETPLLTAARDRGAQVVGGLGMLVHQAALQVELWSGQVAPIDAMLAAVRSA